MWLGHIITHLDKLLENENHGQMVRSNNLKMVLNIVLWYFVDAIRPAATVRPTLKHDVFCFNQSE